MSFKDETKDLKNVKKRYNELDVYLPTHTTKRKENYGAITVRVQIKEDHPRHHHMPISQTYPKESLILTISILNKIT